MNVQIIWSCFAILAFLFFPLSDLWVHSCTKKANKTVPFSQLFKLTSVSVSNIISYPWSFISWVATCLVAILLKPLTFSVAPLIRVYCFNLLTLASFLLRQVCKLNSCFRAAFFLRNSYFLQVIMSLNQLLDILKMYFFESFLRHCLLGKVDFGSVSWLPGWILVGSFPESCPLEVSPSPSIGTTSVVERSRMPFDGVVVLVGGGWFQCPLQKKNKTKNEQKRQNPKKNITPSTCIVPTRIVTLKCVFISSSSIGYDAVLLSRQAFAIIFTSISASLSAAMKWRWRWCPCGHFPRAPSRRCAAACVCCFRLLGFPCLFVFFRSSFVLFPALLPCLLPLCVLLRLLFPSLLPLLLPLAWP